MKLKYVMLVFAVMIFASWGASSVEAKKPVVERGKKITFDYTLNVDGEQVDSSKKDGPITCTLGDGTIIRGLAKQLRGMSVGEEKDITVSPGEAYGYRRSNAEVEVPLSKMPRDVEIRPGAMLQGKDANGKVFPVRVVEVNKDTVIVDHNHPLAGKTLNFHVKILSIE